MFFPALPWGIKETRKLSSPENTNSHVKWDRSAFQVTLAASWRLMLEMRVVLHCNEGRQSIFGAEEAVGEEPVPYTHCTCKETLCRAEAFIWPR